MQKSEKDTQLKPEIEKVLEDIDSGKIKTKRYKNAQEFLNHVDETLSK